MNLLGCDDSFNFFEEIFYLNACITERAFKCLAINFAMKRENNNSPVSMFHLDMAAFSMNLNKA